MEKDKDIIKIIVDDEEFSVKDKKPKRSIKTYISGLEQDLSPMFVRFTCLICVGIAMISFAVGLLVPKSEKSISDRVFAMQKSDKKYLSAKEAYNSIFAEVDNKKKEIEEKNKSVEKADNAQSSIDKIISDNEALVVKRDGLKVTIEEKKRTLSESEALINANKSKTVTLNSGEYTVGENITAGKFNVLGKGSVAISRNGKSVTNKSLKSDGEVFTLENGDKIIISGSAKFIPE